MSLTEDMVVFDQVGNLFTLDEREGVADPLEMSSSTLEAHSHCIVGRRIVREIVTAACKRAGLKVDKVSVSVVAAASVLLSRPERMQGVCLVDIGGEYTTIVIYTAYALCHSAFLPWGGNHLTSCIGMKLGLDKPEAEQAKLAYAQRSIAGEASRRGRVIRDLLDVRVRELCELIDGELGKPRWKEDLQEGIVLADGTSRLPGLAEHLHKACNLPVRQAEFRDANWLADAPVGYAGAIGLALHHCK